MKGKIAPIKKHSKENYIEKCPSCGSEDISEVSGWCYSHQNPTFEADSRFCTGECGTIIPIEGAYFCNDCDTIYDAEKMTNWNWGNVWYAGCPVGEEIGEPPEFEGVPEEYKEKLFQALLEYKKDRINDCVRQGFYLEAVIYLHRNLFEELRFLLLEKIKGTENISFDEQDPRFKKFIELLKNMADSSLLNFAFIYGRVDDEERGKIKALNTLRNKFVHAWNKDERAKYSPKNVENIITDVMKIADKLLKKIKGFHLGLGFPQMTKEEVVRLIGEPRSKISPINENEKEEWYYETMPGVKVDCSLDDQILHEDVCIVFKNNTVEGIEYKKL